MFAVGILFPCANRASRSEAKTMLIELMCDLSQLPGQALTNWMEAKVVAGRSQHFIYELTGNLLDL